MSQFLNNFINSPVDSVTKYELCTGTVENNTFSKLTTSQDLSKVFNTMNKFILINKLSGRCETKKH